MPLGSISGRPVERLRARHHRLDCCGAALRPRFEPPLVPPGWRTCRRCACASRPGARPWPCVDRAGSARETSSILLAAADRQAEAFDLVVSDRAARLAFDDVLCHSVRVERLSALRCSWRASPLGPGLSRLAWRFSRQRRNGDAAGLRSVMACPRCSVPATINERPRLRYVRGLAAQPPHQPAYNARDHVCARLTGAARRWHTCLEARASAVIRATARMAQQPAGSCARPCSRPPGEHHRVAERC